RARADRKLEKSNRTDCIHESIHHIQALEVGPGNNNGSNGPKNIQQLILMRQSPLFWLIIRLRTGWAKAQI
ncbi:hypothetical protein MTR67_013484, partial [Solanum verrucosum]